MFQKMRFAIAKAICPIHISTISVPTSIPAPSTREIPSS